MNQKINTRLCLWISSSGVMISWYTVFFTNGVIFSVLLRNHVLGDEAESQAALFHSIFYSSLSSRKDHSEIIKGLTCQEALDFKRPNSLLHKQQKVYRVTFWPDQASGSSSSIFMPPS